MFIYSLTLQLHPAVHYVKGQVAELNSHPEYNYTKYYILC
jgi:hypothetical protein